MEDFVTYDIAFEMHKLGYNNEKLFGVYSINDKTLYQPKTNLDVVDELFFIKAPLYQQAIDWLRDVHGIHIMLDYGLGWGYELMPVGCKINIPNIFEEGNNWNYYEARLASIEKALYFIK